MRYKMKLYTLFMFTYVKMKMRYSSGERTEWSKVARKRSQLNLLRFRGKVKNVIMKKARRLLHKKSLKA